ncbi:MAG: glycosyltransferase [Chloroflexi bacterium]|nr:glycosyltransferase [Chloroflexota bacterium]
MSVSQATELSTLRAIYLSRVRLNPYVNLLADGVQRADSSIRVQIRRTMDWRWLLYPRLHILHVHWVELQYSYGNPTWVEADKAARDLLRKLRFAQRRGIRLVYTVHNLSQHEGHCADLNNAINDWLFANADAIHVHDDASASAVSQLYARENHVYVIPHGNYIGVYPNEVKREVARRQLAIPPEHFVYLCLGQVRPYKGLDKLVDAFDDMAEPNTTLVVAGKAGAPGYEEEVRARVNGNPNIKLISNFIDDADLQYYFNAADVCVLPYRHATTSGAALLAYSFGKPLVAPALGPFPGLITPERGVLFNPDERGLRKALDQARFLDTRQAEQAAYAFAESRDWTLLGSQHVSMYRSSL